MSTSAVPRTRRPRLPATWGGRIGWALLAVVVLLALVGPLVAGSDATRTVGAPYASPGGGAVLGADFLGRDVLARALAGGRSVLLYATVATVLAYVGGLTVGLVAGYARSWVDPLLMRAVDVLLAFPALVFILVVAAGLGRGVTSVVLATAVVQLPSIARLIRTATLEQSVRGYVEAAIARGERPAAVLRREILPNISDTIAADIGLRFTWSVLLIASVNFLGLGLQPPAADWGLMISENRGGIALNPWAVLVPAAVLGVLTVAINLVSDSLVRTRR